MAEMSPGTALRQLQQTRAALRKGRQAIRLARTDPQARDDALKIGWESLVQTHRVLASIPLAAVTEPVLTQQLSVQRYATALLVRLRRLLRNELPDEDEDDRIEGEEDAT
jgi:hypothetical protein